jgi:hypothetical protein
MLFVNPPLTLSPPTSATTIAAPISGETRVFITLGPNAAYTFANRVNGIDYDWGRAWLARHPATPLGQPSHCLLAAGWPAAHPETRSRDLCKSPLTVCWLLVGALLAVCSLLAGPLLTQRNDGSRRACAGDMVFKLLSNTIVYVEPGTLT